MAYPYNAFCARIAGIYAAGEAAARLRKAGDTPNSEGEASHHGAFQWAEACGFAECKEERSLFTHAFLAELERK